MKPSVPPNEKCPQGQRESCPLSCKYNHFESEDLVIDAWELKCDDCGWRDTVGYRSDETEDDADVSVTRCPFCQRDGLCPGKNPCAQEPCEQDKASQ